MESAHVEAGFNLFYKFKFEMSALYSCCYFSLRKT